MVFSLQSTRNASEVFVITYCANPHWARYTHICTHNITLDHNEVQAKTFKAFSCYKPTHRLFFTLPHTHMKPQKPRTQSYTHRTAGFSTNGSSNLPPHTPPHTVITVSILICCHSKWCDVQLGCLSLWWDISLVVQRFPSWQNTQLEWSAVTCRHCFFFS